MKKSLFILLSVVSVFYFNSCENFLKSNELKEQIQESIDYANADVVTINITQKNEYGTLSGSTSGTYKVFQTISNAISFQEADKYQFINWRIYDKYNNEIENGNGIKIARPEDASTTFNVVDSSANGYSIIPYCELRPYITEVSPKYQANGVSRDTELKITFDRNLDKSLFTYSYEELVDLGVCSLINETNTKDDSSENYKLNEDCDYLMNPDNSIFGYKKGNDYQIKNISITSHNGEENLAQYFWKCTLENSILKIYPQYEIDKRYSLDENNKKDIRVTISNIWDNDIQMRYDYIWDFRTNDSTDVKAKIIITSDVYGAISPTGGSYNIGDVINVKFVLDSEKYIFDKVWDKTNEDTLILGDEDYDDANGIYKVNVIVVGECETFQLKPKCTPISEVSINFLTSEGVMSPVGVADYKNNHVYPLSFNPSSEYQFIEWRVYRQGNLLTDEEKSFITIQNPDNAITTFQMNFSNENKPFPFEIKPYCIERPIVLNTTPTNSNVGCYRDEQITVLFDKDMDESSIYFAENEIPAGKEIIYATREGKTDKIYAYADSVTEDGYGNKFYDNKVYKNIEIKNLADQTSLNEYYDEPYFESKTKLIIKTARKIISGGKSESMAPPGSTQVVVTLSKEMRCVVNNIPVKLATNKKFNYLTNQFIDIDPPQFANGSQPIVKHKFGADSKTAVTSINTTDAVYSEMRNILTDSNSFSMFLCFTDSLSGIDSINMYYKRVFDQNYDKINETVKASPLTCQYSADKKHGYFGTNYNESLKTGEPDNIDLDKLNNGDGVYEIYFGVKDINGNEAVSQKYYILKDKTKPVVRNESFNENDFSFSCTSEKFCKINAVYKTKTNGAETIGTSKTTGVIETRNMNISNFSYTSTTPATVNVVFEIEDLAGNKTATKNYSSWTKLSTPIINTIGGTGSIPDNVHKEIINDAGLNTSTLKTITYGRNVIINFPSGIIPTGYKLYWNNTLLGTYKSNSFSVPYEFLSRGNYNLYVKPYVTIDEVDYIGPASDTKVFHETLNDVVFVYVSGNTGNIKLASGFYNSKERTAMDIDGWWYKYNDRSSGWANTSHYNSNKNYNWFTDSCSSKNEIFYYSTVDFTNKNYDNVIFSFKVTEDDVHQPEFYWVFDRYGK